MTDDTPRPGSITGVLHAARSGEPEALDELFSLVYDELRSMARGQRRRWHGNLTLTATAIVHEAYIKLVDRRAIVPESRDHFFAVAARAMRQILCNYARDRQRLKRGHGVVHVPIDDALNALPLDVSDDKVAELAALDDALARLHEVSPRQSRIVECRFFGGMSIEETASALGLSPATVKRDWTMARAWLYREVRETGWQNPSHDLARSPEGEPGPP